MLPRSFLVSAALTGIFAAPLSAQDAVPQSLVGLDAHQVVEAIMAETEALGLTSAQMDRLSSLHVAVRDEPHRYTTRGAPGKAHRTTVMAPMISKQRAYNEALYLLTPEQRGTAVRRFSAPDYKAAISK